MTKHTWNHRVLKQVHAQGDSTVTSFSIHEVHYDDDKHTACTVEPVRIGYADSVEELRWTLEHMLKALDKPVLNYEEF